MQLRPVALILLAIAACNTGARSSGPAEYVASVTQQYDHVGFFGGLSGLDLDATGSEIVLLSDNGNMIFGRLGRDADGRPLGLRRWRVVFMDEPPGVIAGPRGLDTEGLAISENGVFVSLERAHAVWRVGRDGEVLEQLPRAAAFDDLQENSSLEALAADATGALYTLPERSGGRDRPFPVWRFRNGAWDQPFDLPRRGRFLAVGADFGPDDRLYLLERSFLGPFGFATRVRRFTLQDDRVLAEETLLQTAPGAHDNLEGLAVWRDPAGDIRLTMVSDDNFSWLQKTEIVEYRVADQLEPAASAR